MTSDKLARKLRIYAMLMRLREIEKEQQFRWLPRERPIEKNLSEFPITMNETLLLPEEYKTGQENRREKRAKARNKF